MGNKNTVIEEPFTIISKPTPQGKQLTLPPTVQLSAMGYVYFRNINMFRSDNATLLPPPGINLEILESPYFAYTYSINEKGTFRIYEFFPQKNRTRCSFYDPKESGVNPSYAFRSRCWTCCGRKSADHPSRCD